MQWNSMCRACVLGALLLLPSLAASQFDDLFGGDGGLIVDVEDDGSGTSPEGLLVTERISVGGTYRFTLRPGWVWASTDSAIQEGPQISHDLGVTLFMDARPRQNFRVFARADLRADDAEDEWFRIQELFSDFSVNDSLFFRGGKQNVRWGVGHFFSPADVINVGQIDPTDPQADREGPVALRVNVPWGRSNNLYGYVIANNDNTVALAPRIEFVSGGTEWGFGGYYRPFRAPRVMMTVSSTLGSFGFFGEAVASYGSDRRFVTNVPPTAENPFGLEVVEYIDGWFPSWTAGIRYNYQNPDELFRLTGVMQYFYNGEGYAGPMIPDNFPGVLTLLSDGDLRASDLRQSGQHYAAVSLTWNQEQGGPEFSPSLLWLSNISDGSGIASITLPFNIWQPIGTSLTLSWNYGRQGSEFAFGGPFSRVTFNINLGHGSF